MLKIYPSLILLLVLCLAACKKDSTPIAPSAKQKVYLVKSITTDGRLDQTFEYDDKNRMKTWLIVGVFEYSFTYDADNRLKEVRTYDFGFKQSVFRLVYEYTSKQMLITEYFDYQNTHTVNKRIYDLIDNRIVKGRIDDPNSFYWTYKYDAAGNLTYVAEFEKSGKLTVETEIGYDNKNGAFSMMQGTNPFFFIGSIYPRAGYKTNAIRSGKPGEPPFTSISYQYNEDGFPVSSLSHYTEYADSRSIYEYIIK